MSEATAQLDLPDRVRLPFDLDAAALAEEVRRLPAEDWVDHLVRQNYEGAWRVVPLRSAAGETHRLRMIHSDPGAKSFVDTPYLHRMPAMRAALARFECPLRSVRLMRLTAGSRIKPHCDPGLDAAAGLARLQVPIETDDAVEFLLNGRPVAMAPGSVWYLRLTDPHSVTNRGLGDRTHLVVDTIVDPWLMEMLRRGAG